MRITERTLYSAVEPIEKYFSQDTVAAIEQTAEKKYGAMYDLPFADFFACANGDFSRLGKMVNPTVLQVYWIKRFRRFVGEFEKAVKAATLKNTADEKRAGDGLLDVSWGEGILIFLQKWFGLKSYKEAEQITMGEILIAKRAQYNQDLFGRNLMKIQTAKMKKL